MTTEAAADRAIALAAEQLRVLKRRTGADYWSDGEADALRAELRRLIGSYGSWAEDRMPMHQRLRRAAAIESGYAELLWPGASESADRAG